ncbi:TIGR03009 domain-containing protein [Stieleria varia]|nr:TIGR03009 domain-containing protein [Stieleria varia]
MTRLIFKASLALGIGILTLASASMAVAQAPNQTGGAAMTPQQAAARQQALAQQRSQPQQLTPQQEAYLRQQQLAQQQAAQQRAAAAAASTAQAPFPPLDANAQARLDQILAKWEEQTKGTKTLECTFQRWHFDLLATPPGVYADKSIGDIKYSAPDKGLFKVNTKLFFTGMEGGKPQYAPQPGMEGEWYVCTGKEVLEYDRSIKQCTIQELPKEMQGVQIFNSPLPFVFNLDAEQMKQKFWIREVESKEPGMLMLEVWPKTAEDRAQYKVVQIGLGSDFVIKGLVMYAPNFHPKNAPTWDQYQFDDVKRNSFAAGIQQFWNFFIPEKLPAGWNVQRGNLLMPPQPQMANGNQAAPPRR